MLFIFMLYTIRKKIRKKRPIPDNNYDFLAKYIDVADTGNIILIIANVTATQNLGVSPNLVISKLQA